MKEREDRLVGVQNTFRYPEEVDALIQKEYYRRIAEWQSVKRRDRGLKPTINEIVSELLRLGLENMDTVNIPEDWDRNINRVFMPFDPTDKINARIKANANAENF